MKYKVNKDLLLLKSLFFFELSIISCLFVYLTPFLSEWGINATEMAIISFVTNIFGFFARPFVGFFADKYQKYKELIALMAILCSVLFSLHLASPKLIRPVIYTLNAEYHMNVSSDLHLLTIYIPRSRMNSFWPQSLYQCQIRTIKDFIFTISLDEVHHDNVQYSYVTTNHTRMITLSSSSALSCTSMSSEYNSTRTSLSFEYNNTRTSLSFEKSFINQGLTWSKTFWILGMMKMFGFICFSPLVSLTDAATFISLGFSGGKKFGITRMFGTIGVLVFSFLMAGILELVNFLDTNSGWMWIKRMQRFSQFTPCFIVAMIVFMTIVVIAYFLRVPYSRKEQEVKKSWEVVIRNWETGIFFLFTVLGGFFYVLFSEYFFFIMFKRYPSLPKYFIGLITAVMTISESTAMGLSTKLLKIKRYEVWVSLSFLAWTIRWFSYIFTENFWFLLLTEVLSGPSAGLMLASMISHASTLATSSTQGRVMGLFSGMYFNIGGAMGGLIGGIILDNLGMFGLFKLLTAVSAICCIYCPLQICVSRRQRKSPQENREISIKEDESHCNGNHSLL